MQTVKLLILCFVVVCVFSEKSSKDNCGVAKNCGECMGINPNCSWCYDNEYDDTKEGPGHRCADANILISRGCPKDKIEADKSVLVGADSQSGQPVPGDQPSGSDIQLTPRAQTIRVRPHDALTINFTFRSISDYPVDLYFLTDLSYTMIDDLETVSKLTHEIVRTMQIVTKKLHMGFGAFVDKPVFPFVVPTLEYLRNPCLSVGNVELQCDPPFLFKHILSLTSDFEEFRQKTKVTRPSGNLDSPEGGLDALLQVAYCNEHINWRTNARKIVLFASDGGFHLAGDGRIAGLIRPPPTKCELTYQADRFNSSLKYLGWHSADQTDYPSVGEIAQVLTDTDISVIFAVDSKLHSLYSKLAAFLPSAAVGILSNSSNNIVRLLKENYDKIVNKAELMTSYNADNIEVQVFAKCHGETEFSKKSICLEHPVGGRIDYQISVKAKGCFSSAQTVTLKMVGLEDQASIQVITACDCPTCRTAQSPALSYSPRCQGQGRLECGACRCENGYTGEFCECSPSASAPGSDAAMLAQCTKPGDQEPCSERGRCICGKCKCNLARYEGNYCECDRHGCKRASDDNQVCGGPQRGTCQCDGTCRCKPGYTGERCDCMESDRQCRDPNNPSELCSGRGVCDCGQCFCNSGFTGHLCNEIQGEPSALCSDQGVEKCVLCLRDALIKAFDASAKVQSASSGSGSASQRPSTKATELAVPVVGEYASPEYAAAGATCSAVCNETIVDTTRVKFLDSTDQQQKDDANLCLIYTDDNCRVYFTYRYSDAIYVDRKVDLTIFRKSECVQTINILYIVLGVIGGIVLGGLILLLIYKLVITIDDRHELAKFERQGENMRWELAENPIFESPTTKVINPTFEDNGY